MTNANKFVISLIVTAIGWTLPYIFSFERHETLFALGCAVGLIGIFVTVFYMGHMFNDRLNKKDRGYY
jgi:hypothetical protein